MDNPETLATLGTQDTGQRQTKQQTQHRKLKGQSRMDNPETLATLGTQDTKQRQTKHKNTTQKTKMRSNVDPTRYGCFVMDNQIVMATI